MDIFLRFKKPLLIIGFLGIVATMGFSLYYLFFRPIISPETDTGPTSTTSPVGFPDADSGGVNIIDDTTSVDTLPDGGIKNDLIKQADPIAKGGITKVTKVNDAPSLGAVLSGDGKNVQYYDRETGKFFRVDDSGNIFEISDKVFMGVEAVTWAPNSNKAILEFPDGANIVYNFEKEKQTTLPSHWKEFDFAPDGEKIVMKSIGLDRDNRWLAITNDDGSKITPINAIGDNDSTIYPSWSPNNQTIAMYTKGIDFNRQELFFVGLNNENFKSAVIEGRGIISEWSPQGDKLLYSVYSSDNGLKPMLWATNAKGDEIGTERKKLNIETWADKCSFSDNSTVYCAVPENLEEGAGLFPELGQATKDRLFKIDLNSGIKQMVAVPEGAYNMSNLVIADSGRFLYFTDEKSELLHKIQLK